MWPSQPYLAKKEWMKFVNGLKYELRLMGLISPLSKKRGKKQKALKQFWLRMNIFILFVLIICLSEKPMQCAAIAGIQIRRNEK